MRYLFLLLCLPYSACTQPTALDSVPRFDEPFGYGVNLGYFPPHFEDKALAALVHGTPDSAEAGIGINTIRPGLYAHFLEQWGYDAVYPILNITKKIGLLILSPSSGFLPKNNATPYYMTPKIPAPCFGICTNPFGTMCQRNPHQ